MYQQDLGGGGEGGGGCPSNFISDNISILQCKTHAKIC